MIVGRTNANLDQAPRLLWPIKQKYGRNISMADVMLLGGQHSLSSVNRNTQMKEPLQRQWWLPVYLPFSHWQASGKVSAMNETDSAPQNIAAFIGGLAAEHGVACRPTALDALAAAISRRRGRPGRDRRSGPRAHPRRHPQ